MADLSSTEMAFSGFGLMQRKPMMVVGWAGLFLAFNLIVSLGTIVTIGPKLQELTRASSTPGDPAALGELFLTIAPWYLVLIAAALGFYAVISASAYRAMLRPDQGAPFHLAFGSDEIRLVLLALIFFLLAIAAYFALVIFVVVLAALGGVLGAVLGGQDNPATVGLVVGLLVVVGIFVSVGAVVFFGTRLSLAAPATFARGELVVFKSWSLTKGKFWALFGGYFLNIVLFVIIELLLIVALVVAVSGAFSMDAYQSMQTERLTSVAAFFSPVSILVTIGGAAISAIAYAYLLAPAAYAYRVLTGPDVGTTFG